MVQISSKDLNDRSREYAYHTYFVKISTIIAKLKCILQQIVHDGSGNVLIVQILKFKDNIQKKQQIKKLFLG